MEVGRRLVAILNREITIDIVEQVTFDRRLEGGEGHDQKEGTVGKGHSRQGEQ